MTYRLENYLQARRAYRHAQRVHGDELLDEILFRQADRSIDHGEWSDALEPEPVFYNAALETQERLLLAVADAYGLDAHRFDDALRELDEDEACIIAPPCPYHERGLECRNSAPLGIDADGEPYGDRGCGCDQAAARQRMLLRMRRARDAMFTPH